jgi:hypothetical protein
VERKNKIREKVVSTSMMSREYYIKIDGGQIIITDE